MSAVAIVVVALLWTLSGVLALAETAFTRVSRIRLLALEEEGDNARAACCGCSNTRSRHSTASCCSCSAVR